MSSKLSVAAMGVAFLALSGNAFALGKPVSIEKLQDRTAFALGLKTEDFTISDVKKEGMFTTRYSVKTKSGDVYGCYVASGMTIGGASDAVCSKHGEPAKNPLLEAAEKRKKK